MRPPPSEFWTNRPRPHFIFTSKCRMALSHCHVILFVSLRTVPIRFLHVGPDEADLGEDLTGGDVQGGERVEAVPHVVGGALLDGREDGWQETGRVRSGARTSVFSSMDRTTAPPAGAGYRPTQHAGGLLGERQVLQTLEAPERFGLRFSSRQTRAM